ncbi:sigma-70 family RNA polymerase sigma factor [Flavihumibacter sp. RY-1]|uniref:Sigma-70 family RNA polymerase sigma factor n=1 Tax=Flavihumibacter fluminis TaxID=2909236 RepID=A0ABS9BFA2_9BACT|nr:sigma-70 family RNA polymerase sigma factor [Flavihumibacter fluminis]MCF1714211.1 sigma-70 family RNA polymerase sigma factor [Flavihumibacter fluminis]
MQIAYKSGGNEQRTPDMELVIALQQADINRPVKELYNSYFEMLTAFLRTKGAAQEEAADIFQESILVFIEAARAGKFKGDSSIKSYLFGIAKNLWLEEIRSSERRNRRQQVFHQASPTIESTEARIFNKEMQKTWLQLFNSIGSVCKAILMGFYYEKLSMRELLDKVSFASEQALRNKKSKCMKALKEMLSKNPTIIQHLKNLDAHES